MSFDISRDSDWTDACLSLIKLSSWLQYCGQILSTRPLIGVPILRSRLIAYLPLVILI